MVLLMNQQSSTVPATILIIMAVIFPVMEYLGKNDEQILEIGGIAVDRLGHQVTVEGKELELSYKEFELHHPPQQLL